MCAAEGTEPYVQYTLAGGLVAVVSANTGICREGEGVG